MRCMYFGSETEKLVVGISDNTIGIAGDLQGLNAVSVNYLSVSLKRPNQVWVIRVEAVIKATKAIGTVAAI